MNIYINIFVIFNFTFFAALIIIYFIPILLLTGFLKRHTTLHTSMNYFGDETPE